MTAHLYHNLIMQIEALPGYKDTVDIWIVTGTLLPATLPMNGLVPGKICLSRKD